MNYFLRFLSYLDIFKNNFIYLKWSKYKKKELLI